MPVLGAVEGQVDGNGILGEEKEWAKVSILFQSHQARREGRIRTHHLPDSRNLSKNLWNKPFCMLELEMKP